MTTEITEIEAVDLSDLDLLDDKHRHAFCHICYPEMRNGTPFIAYCGRRAVQIEHVNAFTPPPNACPECLSIKRCPRCGS